MTARGGGSAADGRRAWGALVQTALLGTARTAGHEPDGPSPVAALLGALAAAEAPPERRLLSQAAVLGAWVRAGTLPAARPIAAGPPAPDDDLPVAPPSAVALLSTMLLGEHLGVLPEWLDRAASTGVRVPPMMIPPLLDLARTSAALRPGVVRVVGGRGRWLAARNPEWSWVEGAADDTTPDAWETGSPAERAAALHAMRRADPDSARERLAETWRTESAAGRATLLAALETGLGAADEPFLERALDDRGREVRTVAAELLATLPGSALVARMTARAAAALRHEPGRLLRRARLVVTLPDAPDSEAVRDGVQPTPPTRVGERAWWLAQIVAGVPPRTWTDAWSMSAARAVELARETEWVEPLADGWARAALRHRDAEWAEALLRANVLVDRHARVAPTRAQLFGVLPPARREALLEDAFAGRAPIDPGELLGNAPAPWSDRFARAALGWFRRRAEGAAAQPDARSDDWRVVERLGALALRLPVALADEARWPADLPVSWARAVERCASVLTFRRALDAAFPPRP